jgi:membrane protein DedA with SNARE-associated domain
MISLPNSKWLIANLVGLLIFTAIYVMFGYLLHFRDMYTNILIYVCIYLVIAFGDFYFYHEGEEEESKKSIGQQIKDMRGSFIIIILILAISGGVTLYRRKQMTEQLSKIFNKGM